MPVTPLGTDGGEVSAPSADQLFKGKGISSRQTLLRSLYPAYEEIF
jgi:hypothetical protein